MLVLVAGVAGFVARGQRTSAPEHVSVASASAPVGVVTPALVPDSVQSTGIGSVTPPPPVSAPLASAKGPTKGQPPKVGATGRPSPRLPTVNPCEIPFTIDDKGMKHFKPECVP